MKISIPLIGLALLASSACGGSSGASTPQASGSRATQPRPSQAAGVYAAVIRQLVTRDHGFGGAPSPYRHVYVLDGVVPSAANPNRLVEQPAKPFPVGFDRQLAAALPGLPSLSFVRSRDLAIAGAEPGHVVHRGVLISLGRIEWVDGRTARVGNNRWGSGLNGQWLTYTVKYDQASWRVVGVSGNKIAIS
jgi:hypothetical protein